MDNATAPQPGTVALEPPSTVLNPETVSSTSGGGRPELSPASDEGSIGSVLEAELARLKEADAKPADVKTEPEAKKAEPDEKGGKSDADKPDKARADDGKFAKAEKSHDQQPKAEAEKGEPAKAAEQAAPERRQSEGRHPEPPARFLPEARDKWAPVPREIKAEVHRVVQEIEGENQQFRASHERYAQIKDFDDLARSNGRDLRDSLVRVNQIENALQQNPIAALNMVLAEAGPRKQDGSPLTIMDVAQYLVQNPGAFQQAAAAHPQVQAQAQPQTNAEVEQLKAMVLEMQAQQTVVPVIEAFRQGHPDFDDLSPQIEEILTSGVIEKLYGTGLSPEQRLAQAYRMVGGRPPSSNPDPADPAADSQGEPSRAAKAEAGTKSVRGAPADGLDTPTDDTETDLSEMLRKEARKLKVIP